MSNFSTVSSGWVPINGDGYFFYKEAENKWSLVMVPDIYSAESVAKLYYVSKKVGTENINKHYIETLASEFNTTINSVNDSVIIGYLTQSSGVNQGSGNRPDGDYLVYGSSVIVNGIRYGVGQTVYYNGFSYLVDVGSDGQAYLAHPDGGSIGDTPVVGVEESVHYFDYTKGMDAIQSDWTESYAHIRNSITSGNPNKLVMQSSGNIERILKSSPSSTMRYWEYFKFHSGIKAGTGLETVVTYDWSGLQKLSSVGGSTVVEGKWECFKYYSNTEGVTKYRHYTQLENGISSVTYNYSRAIYHTGEGKFTVYKFSKSVSSKDVGDYFRKHPDFPYYTYSALEYLHSKFGKGRDTLDISNVTELKKYGLYKCPGNVIPNVEPGSGVQTKSIRTFNVNSSTFHLDVDIKTFLSYGSNKDTISRGKVKVHLYRGNTLVNTDMFDSNVEKIYTKTFDNMVKGEYRVVLELEDTYQDNKEIYVNAKTRVREVRTKTNGLGERDDSEFVMTITNSSGQIVPIDGNQSIVFDCSGVCERGLRLEVPKGETYIVRGVFTKPIEPTIGGYNDAGAALEVSQGVVKFDLIARRFPPGKPIEGGTGGESGILPPDIKLPIPGWEISDPVIEIPGDGEVGAKDGPFFWADIMKIETRTYSEIDQRDIDEIINRYTCYPLGTYVNIDTEGIDYDQFMGANPQLVDGDLFEGRIRLNFTNPTTSDIKVRLTFEVDDNWEDCGGGGLIKYYGGGFEFWGYDWLVGDGVDNPIRNSTVSVGISEYHPNHTTIGGCNGSYVDVVVKQNGNVVKTYKINENTPTKVDFVNLFEFGDTGFDIEVVTHQLGEIDPRGYDLRSTFMIRKFELITNFELSAVNFDSQLDFYINDEHKYMANKVGSGEHYFDVKKGLNKYKFVFSTNLWDYNWDYVEIPWVRLTNWICGEYTVTPYCDEGRGDECVEALIGCLIGLLPPVVYRGCVTVRYFDCDTGELLKQFTKKGFKTGYHIIKADVFDDYIVDGSGEKEVHVSETSECAVVDFCYRRTYRRCVYVYHIDEETGILLKKVPYYNLTHGWHIFKPIEISGYTPADGTEPIEFFAENTLVPEECYGIHYYYKYVGDRNPYLDCMYIIHYEYGNPGNIFETETLYNLKPGKLIIHAKEYEGYRVVGENTKEIDIRTITDPLDCLSEGFEYEPIPKDCVVVKYVDRVNEKILDTDYHYDLLPGEYIFKAKEFEDYRLVSVDSYTILIVEDGITEECKEVTFLYEPIVKGCALGKKIWLFT